MNNIQEQANRHFEVKMGADRNGLPVVEISDEERTESYALQEIVTDGESRGFLLISGLEAHQILLDRNLQDSRCSCGAFQNNRCRHVPAMLVLLGAGELDDYQFKGFEDHHHEWMPVITDDGESQLIEVSVDSMFR
jgi:hypothetical protein